MDYQIVHSLLKAIEFLDQSYTHDETQRTAFNAIVKQIQALVAEEVNR